MFKKILIASDLTPASLPALHRGLMLAAEHGASAVVLHVNERHHPGDRWLSPPFDDELVLYRALVRREEDAALRILAAQSAEVLARAPGVEECLCSLTPSVRSGRAAETIVGAAAEVKADLVVVGTRGRRGTIGSVAEHVVREAPCPVLVVSSVAAAIERGRERERAEGARLEADPLC
jgi:nucleotide-binding universal stress UspA family protein